MDKESQIAILQTMLAHIKFDNPEFDTLIRKEIISRNKTQEQTDIAREITRRLRIQNKKLMAQVASLKDQVKDAKTNSNQLLNQLNDLRKLNKALSGAVGSCDSCWGEDSNCVKCRGNGYPGWRNINRRLFNIYILPALEKVYKLSEKIKLNKS